MKINFILILLLCGVLLKIQAQNPTFEWMRNTTYANDYQSLTGVATDNNNNIYVTGSYNAINSITFNNGTTLQSSLPAGKYPSFVARFDVSGTLVWKRDLGTTLKDATANIVYHNNALYVATRTTETETIEGITVSGGNACLLKYDLSGTLLWMDTIASTLNPIGISDLVLDNNDNIYVVGSTPNGIVTQGNIYGATNNTVEAFVLKYNNLGVVQWVKTFGSENYSDGADAVVFDNMGHLYITGRVRGNSSNPVLFDNFSFQTNGATFDSYLAKLDANTGTVIWVDNFGSSASDQATDVVVDNLGKPYITGTLAYSGNGFTSVPVDFGNGVNIMLHAGSLSPQLATGTPFIVQFDTAGIAQWSKRLPTPGGGANYRPKMEVLMGDTIVVLGEGRDSMHFDNGGTNDIRYMVLNSIPNTGSLPPRYIAKLTTAGIWTDARPMNLAILKSIAVNNNGNIYAVGEFEETYYYSDMDSIVAVADADAFLGKIGDLTAITLNMPTNLTVTNAFKSAVAAGPGFDLSWQDNSSNEEGFIIYYQKPSMTWQGYLQKDIPISNTVTARLDGLDANTAYEMYMVAYTNRREILSAPTAILLDTTESGLATGLEETVEQNSMLTTIASNPSSTGSFLLKSDAEHISFQVLSIEGRVLKHGVIGTKQYLLNLAHFPQGTYLLRLRKEEKEEFHKLMIIK